LVETQISQKAMLHCPLHHRLQGVHSKDDEGGR
jgi:hypothetical protein